MQKFSEQLAAARKAKGLTQDAIAQAVSVTRQTVSSWERGRTLPDIDAVRKLSALLEYDFFQEGAEFAIPAADEQDDQAPAPAAEEPRPEGVPARKPPQKVMWIIACAAVLVCVGLAFFLRGMHSSNSASKDVFSDEYYQQVTPNDPEKAFLVFENIQWQEKGENQTFDRYNFKMHEKNGIGMDIVSVELKALSKNGNVRTATFAASDLRAGGAPDSIEPYGESYLDGGWPAGEFAKVGIAVHGVDKNGAQLTFYSMMKF